MAKVLDMSVTAHEEDLASDTFVDVYRSPTKMLINVTTENRKTRWWVENYPKKNTSYVVDIIAAGEYNETVNKLILDALKALKLHQDSYSDDPSTLADQIPGIHQKVKHPVTGNTRELFSVIMSLNDQQRWTRDKIADWLETLSDCPVFEVIQDEAELYTVTKVDEIKRVLQSGPK